jgi:signal transduction histidine kinase
MRPWWLSYGVSVVVRLGALVAGSALVLAAAWFDVSAHLPSAQVVADVAVGAGFLVSAAALVAPNLTRLLTAGVGVLWLVGSILPVASAAHRPALAICLLVFPAGRLVSGRSQVLAVMSLGLAGAMVPQILVAGVFLAIAAERAFRGRWTPTGRSVNRGEASVTAVTAALALAAVLGASGLWAGLSPNEVNPHVVLFSYEGTLIVVVIALTASTRLHPHLAELPDTLLGTAETGSGGLGAVLRTLLRDPDLRIVGAGENLDNVDLLEHHSVIDEGSEVATVHHRRGSIPDDDTLQAVLEAVRLSVAHEQVSAELERQRIELLAARTRLQVAAERRRGLLHERLRREILEPIAIARADVARVSSLPGSSAQTSALAVAGVELAGAETEIRAVADGLPPLGPGSLASALRGLAARDARVTVDVDPCARADERTESALRFVASELVTNALKHSSARLIRVTLRLEEDEIVLVVMDDGVGDANALGDGLVGVDLRVTACGGRLSVDSPPGGGTTATVRAPVRTPSSKA